MKHYIQLIQHSSVFKNFSESEILTILGCIDAQKNSFTKNESVFNPDDNVNKFGLLLSGKLIIQKVDIDGNLNIISKITEGDLFAEAFVYANVPKMSVQVICLEKSEVLFIDKNKIINLIDKDIELYKKFNENMLTLLARKLIYLNKKVDVITKQSIREKVLTYLNTFYTVSNNKFIEIPYNREQLADFLCVNRTALSRELSNMKNDGIIDYYKNTFKLL